STPKAVKFPFGIYRVNSTINITELGSITLKGEPGRISQIFQVGTTGFKLFALEAPSYQSEQIVVQDLFLPTPSGSGVTDEGNVAFSVVNNAGVIFDGVTAIGHRRGIVCDNSFAPKVINCEMQNILGPAISAPGDDEGNAANIISSR